MEKVKKITKELIVKLTPEEKAERATQLTERISRKDWLEDAKRVSSKHYAAQIEECVADINDLSNKIRTGEELRAIECEIRYDDPVPGYKTTYRLDTGVKISSEIMTESEQQLDLFVDLESENNDEDQNAESNNESVDKEESEE